MSLLCHSRAGALLPTSVGGNALAGAPLFNGSPGGETKQQVNPAPSNRTGRPLGSSSRGVNATSSHSRPCSVTANSGAPSLAIVGGSPASAWESRLPPLLQLSRTKPRLQKWMPACAPGVLLDDLLCPRGTHQEC
ncbi:hypothetical protein NDU88_009315 [Pleurodeles waltl]|uniref:Uncharacterized protein n=1 Tax=Pleurodeles waltl TaxID=8319 RepID=A0AAV7RVV3_PLEWA|nr:hypothetical protein NDU88_009315 [Pleurodeles waltl]